MENDRLGVSSEDAVILVDMWAPQLAEHALFLHMLLHEKELKQRGLDIFLRWREYLCEGAEDTPSLDIDVLFSLIDELHNYKVEIINRLKSGEWLGATYVSFVEHILRELVYFEDKLAGVKMTASEEVDFWNRINSEHAGLASHLLDPSETDLTDTADELSKRISDLPVDGDISSIVMAIEAGAELSEFNKKAYLGVINDTIKSVIPESILYHIIREDQFGKAVLNGLIGKGSGPISKAKICEHEL